MKHFLVLVGVFIAFAMPANAQDHSGHAMMGAVSGNKPVPVKAVINKVDADKGVLNVTHEPIPSINWPKMTMDLPITKRVDLSNVKEGMNAEITLKQGRDKQYRIISIEPAK